MFYIALQTPTIEMEVKCKDAAGNSATMIVGFTRYKSDKGMEMMQEVTRLVQKIAELEAEGSNTVELETCKEEYSKFIRSNIEYYKGVDVLLPKANGGGMEKFRINDTRNIREDSPVYDPEQHVKDILDDMFLDSTPWKLAISGAMQRAFFNAELGEESGRKN